MELRYDLEQRYDAGLAGCEPVTIDCDHCAARGVECGDCVVTFLLGEPPDGTALDEDEQRALRVLAAGGLLPPLRMARAVSSRIVDDA